MSADDFVGQELTEKLAKLNSSQQAIESLSRWCITHRMKAKQIVETWDKMFKSAQREQRVSFLYLANDILQNSRRKGSEFVNEFWKFLPAALKHVCHNGDEHGKKVASRLVDIWEERKVFGSRGQNLKDEVLGKGDLPTSGNGKSSNPIKVVKRDAQSLRIKLAVGGRPEKIISAFQMVLDENVSEESAVKKCDLAISCVKDMEKDTEDSSLSGNSQNSGLVDKIQEAENNLTECVTQLQNSARIRTAFVSELKEALQDQEAKLELIHNKLEIARGQIELAEYLKQKLKSSVHLAPQSVASNVVTAMRAADANFQNAQLTSSPRLPPSQSLSAKLTEESKKAAAAAVAAKLTASTSSAQMLTSVLSSLVAEEAASRSSGFNIHAFSSLLPFGSPEKRIKLDNSVSNVNQSESSHSTYFSSSQPQPVSNMPPDPTGGMQISSQGNQMQPSYPQPPPPPPPIPPQSSPVSQVGQTTAMMMSNFPYGYGGSNLPPPPLSSHIQMGYARPSLPTQQPLPQHLQAQPPQKQQHVQGQESQQQQQQQQQMQPSLNGTYYRPPGVGFYGQNHQPTSSPVPRQ